MVAPAAMVAHAAPECFLVCLMPGIVTARGNKAAKVGCCQAPMYGDAQHNTMMMLRVRPMPLHCSNSADQAANDMLSRGTEYKQSL